ncbi:hypothetical protein GCM10027447_03120 [Glycomyces halotolerans]
MYDQNRPEEPQRPPGDEKPARRRIGRSWGPKEDTAEAEDAGQVGQTPQAMQAPEQYRFDPDRGRRHRYSEEPTGQMPGVPVEIAETGPTMPATRRPSPGEQFEPMPPAPQRAQGPQQESPFAPPPGANHAPSAPPGMGSGPGANNAQSGPRNAGGTPPAADHAPSAPQQEASRQQYSAPPSPVRHANPQQHQTPVQPPQGEVEHGPQPVTEVSPPAVPSPQPAGDPTPAGLPSPPVTEQGPPRTPPAPRQPVLEPTPPVSADDEANDPGQRQLLERVRQVPGVRDAFHVTAPDGSPSLRLELEEGVDPDEVHAAVSAVVAEQRAIEPGPQTVDEPGEEPQVELEPAVAAEAELPAVGHVRLHRVEIDSSGLDAEVAVTVAVGESESSGSVTVPPVDWHVQHAAAAATVEALRPFLGASDSRVEVEHASVVPTGPVKTAVVVILWMDGTAVRRLSGAAVVTAERSRAVVSATLSALAAEVAH